MSAPLPVLADAVREALERLLDRSDDFARAGLAIDRLEFAFGLDWQSDASLAVRAAADRDGVEPSTTIRVRLAARP